MIDFRHVEGGTYLWTYDELARSLTPEEFAAFRRAYRIERAGNFEGSIHLIRKNDVPLPAIEGKLLTLRRQRPQPQMEEHGAERVISRDQHESPYSLG